MDDTCSMSTLIGNKYIRVTSSITPLLTIVSRVSVDNSFLVQRWQGADVLYTPYG